MNKHRLTQVAAVMTALLSWTVAATAQEAPKDKLLVPADKNLSPEYVRMLSHRGERAVYTGQELETIGMPVGGIACGQLYLRGDGTLGLW